MGCVRETSHRKINQSWVVKEKLPPEKQSRHGMCKRNSPDKKKKKKKKSQHGMYKRNSRIKMKPAQGV